MSDTPIYDNIGNEPEKPTVKENVAKILTKPVRRWAYGVSAAALAVWAFFANKPEVIPVIIPLLTALWFVTPEGEPK